MTKSADTEEEFEKKFEALFTEKQQTKEGISVADAADDSAFPPIGFSQCDRLGADPYLCSELAGIYKGRRELEQELVASEAAKSLLERQLQELQVRHQELGDIVAVLKEKFESGLFPTAQPQEDSGLVHRLTFLEETLESRDQEVQRLKATLQEQLQQQQDVVASYESSLTGLQEELMALRTTLQNQAGCQVKDADHELLLPGYLSASEAEIASLHVDLSMTKEALYLAQQRLEGEQTAGALLRADLQGVKEQLVETQKDKEMTTAHQTSLQSQIQAFQEQLTSQKSLMDSLSDDRCLLQLQLNELQEKLRQQDAELTAVKQERDAARLDAETSIADLVTAKSALAVKVQECSNLERQQTALREENQALLSQTGKMQPLEEAQAALTQARLEVIRLQGALEQAELEGHQHAGEAAEFEQKAKEHYLALIALKEQQAALQQELQKARQELTDSQHAEQALESKILRLTHESMEASQLVAKTQELVRAAHTQGDLQKQEAQREIEALKSTQRKQEEQTKLLLQEIETQKNENATLEKKVLDLGKYQHLAETAREHLQEAHLQLQQAQAQQARYKQQCTELQEQVQGQEQEIRALRYKEEQAKQSHQAALLAAEEFREQAAVLEEALHDSKEEVTASKREEEACREQLKVLETQLGQSQKCYEQSQQELAQTSILLESARCESQQLQERLNKKEEGLFQVEQELHKVQEALLQNVHEVGLLKERYATSIEEKNRAMQQLRISQQLIKERGEVLERARLHQEEWQRRAHEQQKALEKAAEEIFSLREQKTALQQQIDELAQERETHQGTVQLLESAKVDYEAKVCLLQEEKIKIAARLKEKDLEIEAIAQKVQTAETAKTQAALDGKVLSEKLQEAHQRYQDAVKAAEDRENRLRMAQQHLAKKMKESAILQEKLDQQKVQFLELQNELNAQKARCGELEGNLRLQQQHEDKLQAMVQERVKVAEAQAIQWQEKFFALQDGTQGLKSRLAELEKLQAEYEQVQSLFSNLKAMVGAPPMSAKEKTPPVFGARDLVPPRHDEDAAAVRSSREEVDSLFASESTAGSAKVRTTLFEG